MNVWLVLEVVLAFGFMIAIHEWGHFIACRLFGVRVDKFALGFGPTLWSKKVGDTEYAIQAVPLGGYCKPAGGDLSGETADKMYEKPPEPGEFLFASWWKRSLIFLAGPSMNYISAVVVIAGALMIGDKVPLEDPILGFVPPKSLAAAAGLKLDDRILKVNDREVRSFYDVEQPLYEHFSSDKDSRAVLSVQRGDRTFAVTLSGRVEKDGSTLGVYPKTPPVIGSVALMTPARNAGVREGDRVLSVDGTPVMEWHQMALLIRGAETDAVTLHLDRHGEQFDVALHRVDNGMYKAIGISPVDPERSEFKRLGFFEAWSASFSATANMSGTFLVSLGKLVTGRISLKDNLAGPVTIVRTMYQKATQGGIEFMNTVAFISLILCLMNLLPIPVVDGGQIVLCALEGVRRKPMSVRFQTVYQQVGFFFVVALMALAVFNDFWGLILEIKNRHL